MDARNGLTVVGLGLALALATPSFAKHPESPKPAYVFLKSADTKLTLNGKAINVTQDFESLCIEKTEGDQLLLFAGCGARGWTSRDNVVPADQAVAYFTSVIAGAPNGSEGYRLRALVYSDANQYDRALRDADEAVRLDPTRAVVYVTRCEIRTALKDRKGALLDGNEAVRLAPGYSNGYFTRAFAFQRMGQPEKALDDLNEAARLDPTDARIYVRFAFYWKENGDVARAIGSCTEAIRVDPTCYGAYMLRSNFRTNTKDVPGALEDADAAIRIDPEEPNCYMQRAFVYYKQHDSARAMADCDRALELKPSLKAAHTLRGILLAEKGRFASALGEVLLHPSALPTVKIN